MSRRLLAGFLCLLSLLALPAELGAQAQKPQRPFGTAVEDWNRSFDSITQQIGRGEISEARAGELKRMLLEIDAEAERIKQNAEAAVDPLQVQLEALGPVPAEGEPPETPEIAEQRQSLRDDIADYQARIKQADLTATRVRELTVRINELSLVRTLETLFEPFPSPLAPDTVAVAGPDFLRVIAGLSQAPGAWWRSLSADEQGTVVYRVALFLVPALVLAWLLRRALLRFFGQDPEIQHPTYTRRLTGAIAEGLAYGIVPAVILATILVRAQSDESLISGLFAEMVVVGCAVAIMFILAWALPRAVLAPGQPAWRLIPFSAESARIIDRRIIYLAGVFAIDIFIIESSARLSPTPELASLFTLVTSTLLAAGIFLLIQGRLWVWEEEPEAAGEDTPAAGRRRGGIGFWKSLRWVAGLVAAAAVASAALGYTNLSGELIGNLLVSTMAIGILFLIRGFLREIVGMALRSRLMQVQLALPHKSRQRYKFWLRVLLDVAMYLSGIVVLLLVWGVPGEDIHATAHGLLQDFTIGNVTISLGDILIAVLLFVAAMAITRALQRGLTEHIFPQTDLDVGIQNSLSSGFGYLGLAIAVILAISAVGLDLSNVALIAGALSVGIGFGLQAIVNNFVSGLILLIERPIKVGDWIVVGAYEGFVKRINVRATEIETFQRASVIVPNSEMISGAVTNWTHKDKYGRVEVPVGVAYGSDVKQVMELLEQCLRAHEQILPWPEPSVLFRGFGDSSLDFEARGFIASVEWRIVVVSDLCIAIEREFREHGIEIPFPQRDLHIRSLEGLDMAERQRLAAGKAAAPAPKTTAAPETKKTAGSRDFGSDAPGDAMGEE